MEAAADRAGRAGGRWALPSASLVAAGPLPVRLAWVAVRDPARERSRPAASRTSRSGASPGSWARWTRWWSCRRRRGAPRVGDRGARRGSALRDRQQGAARHARRGAGATCARREWCGAPRLGLGGRRHAHAGGHRAPGRDRRHSPPPRAAERDHHLHPVGHGRGPRVRRCPDRCPGRGLRRSGPDPGRERARRGPEAGHPGLGGVGPMAERGRGGDAGHRRGSSVGPGARGAAGGRGHTRRALRVAPVELPVGRPLAALRGVESGLEVEVEGLSTFRIQGPGAGGRATAGAVYADLARLVRGERPILGAPRDG